MSSTNTNELLEEAILFFKNSDNADHLLKNHAKYSSRLLNFFLKDYCRNTFLGKQYDICRKTRGTMMDSFRRTNKIDIMLNNVPFETSEAQIIFFKFVIENNVFEKLGQQLEDVKKKKKELEHKQKKADDDSIPNTISKFGFSKNNKVFICRRTKS